MEDELVGKPIECLVNTEVNHSTVFKLQSDGCVLGSRFDFAGFASFVIVQACGEVQIANEVTLAE
jgi:hypothetical protein